MLDWEQKTLNRSINLVVSPQVYICGHISHWYSSTYMSVSLDHLPIKHYSENPNSFSYSQMKTTTKNSLLDKAEGLV